MSRDLKETIPLMCLMQDINVVFSLYIPKPTCVIKVHKDNKSCIVMATNPKVTPQTGHISIKYHHFKQHVKTLLNKEGFIEIFYCPTQEQIPDIFTKPTSADIFWKLRKYIFDGVLYTQGTCHEGV